MTDRYARIRKALAKRTEQSDHARWLQRGIENRWSLPPRPFVFRLPLIKRVAYAIMMHRLDYWYSIVPGIRTGYDEWVLYGWWYGLADGGGDVG